MQIMKKAFSSRVLQNCVDAHTRIVGPTCKIQTLLFRISYVWFIKRGLRFDPSRQKGDLIFVPGRSGIKAGPPAAKVTDFVVRPIFAALPFDQQELVFQGNAMPGKELWV